MSIRVVLRGVGRAVLVLVVLISPSALLAEGTQTGIVVGQVLDTSGTGVEGASVKLLGPRGERTAVSVADGLFRVPALPVGTYRVQAELPGVGLESNAKSVEVFIDRTTDVELSLVPADQATEPIALEEIEVIEVSAEAPLIDPFDARLGGNVRYEFVDELPLERFYQSVALMLPGVAGGQDGNPNINGSLDSHNLYLIDGVDTTDPTTGLFGLNLNYEAIQEVAVTTGGFSAEYGRASGGVINVVTRSGTNWFEGSARWVGTNPDWNDDYELRNFRPGLAEEVEAANSASDDLQNGFALALGGPVVRDRLWFFSAYEEPEASFRRPVLEGADAWNRNVEGEREAYKLTWQVSDRHSVVGQLTADSTAFNDFQPFNNRPDENQTIGGQGVQPRDDLNELLVDDQLPGDVFAVERREQDGRFGQFQWHGRYGADVSTSLTLASQERDLTRGSASSRGLTADSPHFDADRGLVFNGTTMEGQEERTRDQANFDLSLFLGEGSGTHELSVGLDYQETESGGLLQVPGQVGQDRATGNPVNGQLFIDFDFRAACLASAPDFDDCKGFDGVTGEFQPFLLWNFWRREPRQTQEENFAAYVADEFAAGRWYFNIGLRYEDLEAFDESNTTLVDQQTVSPRLAVTYDFAGNGRTIVSASIGRYYEPVLHQFVDLFERTLLFSGFTDYIFDFDNPACTAAAAVDPQSECWIDPLINPLSPETVTSVDPDLDRSFVDEWIVGVEHQIGRNVGLSLHYVNREWDDLWDDVFFVTEFVDGQPVDFDSEFRNLDLARREYQAVQLQVQRRYADRWQLLGSYTWSETEGNLFRNDGVSFFGDFTDITDAGISNRLGPAPYDREHQFKVFGNYRVPVSEQVWVSMGTALRYESGTPFERLHFLTEDELGREFTNAEFLESFIPRFVTPRGSSSLGNIFQWDLSLAVDLPIWKALDLELKTEVFNVTDEQEQIGVDRVDNFDTFGQPRSIFDIQAPRSYRLTVGLRF